MIGNHIKTKSGNSKLAIIIATVKVPKTLLRTLNSYNKVGTSTPIYVLSNNPEKRSPLNLILTTSKSAF